MNSPPDFSPHTKIHPWVYYLQMNFQFFLTPLKMNAIFLTSWAWQYKWNACVQKLFIRYGKIKLVLNLALQNMPLTVNCSMWVPNPKTFGVQGRSPHVNKKILRIFCLNFFFQKCSNFHERCGIFWGGIFGRGFFRAGNFPKGGVFRGGIFRKIIDLGRCSFYHLKEIINMGGQFNGWKLTGCQNPVGIDVI